MLNKPLEIKKELETKEIFEWWNAESAAQKIPESVDCMRKF